MEVYKWGNHCEYVNSIYTQVKNVIGNQNFVEVFGIRKGSKIASRCVNEVVLSSRLFKINHIYIINRSNDVRASCHRFYKKSSQTKFLQNRKVY